MTEQNPEYVEPTEGQDPEGHDHVEEDVGTDADEESDDGPRR